MVIKAWPKPIKIVLALIFLSGSFIFCYDVSLRWHTTAFSGLRDWGMLLFVVLFLVVYPVYLLMSIKMARIVDNQITISYPLRNKKLQFVITDIKKVEETVRKVRGVRVYDFAILMRSGERHVVSSNEVMNYRLFRNYIIDTIQEINKRTC